jgi:cell division septal protein FtsQ
MSISYILRLFGIFYGHLVHFVVIWVYFVVIWVYFVVIWVYFVVIWVYFSILVCCTKKNLATLLEVDLKEALGILHDSTKFD